MDITPLVLLFTGFCALYGVFVAVASLYGGKRMNVEKDYSYTPKVSVILSAFNEGRSVYDTIATLKSVNYPDHLLEIIAFDDFSKDDTWVWMQKAESDFRDVRIFANPHNMGKAPTMAIAAGFATGDIIISTDADTMFDRNAIRELVCCFGDPKVGAVGGSIGIEDVNRSLLSQMQSVFYNCAYWLFKPMENLNGATQCLGGPLAAFRREIYLDIVPEALSRNFFGEPLHNGDDRFITQCVLLRGWKTYTNLDAKCWVQTPVSWDNFFKQQIRWRRSAIGQFVITLSNLPSYIRRAGVLPTVGSILPMMTNIAWLLAIVWMVVSGTFIQAIMSLIAFKLVILPFVVIIFNHIFKYVDASQVVKNPALCAFFVPVWFVISVVVVTPFAFFTLDDGGWVTRQNGLTGNA